MVEKTFPERWKALAEIYRARGFKDNVLMTDYLNARDAELENVPDKKGKRYALYDFMKNMEKRPVVQQEFFEGIFSFLERQAEEKSGVQKDI